MKVHQSIGQANLTNIHRINQSITARNNHRSVSSATTELKDRVTISLQGKKNSLLDNLMKQKTNLTEQKNSLIHATLKTGGALDTIQSQLDNYDQQMKNVDDQIAEIMAREMEKRTEQANEQEDNKPKTEEEIQNERLAGITDLSRDLKQIRTVSSVQNKIDGEARVLKSEIQLDLGRVSKELIAKKEEALASMKQKSATLTSEVADQLSDISAPADEVNQPQEISPDDEATNKMNESIPLKHLIPYEDQQPGGFLSGSNQ